MYVSVFILIFFLQVRLQLWGCLQASPLTADKEGAASAPAGTGWPRGPTRGGGGGGGCDPRGLPGSWGVPGSGAPRDDLLGLGDV